MTKHNYIPGKAYKMRCGAKTFYVGDNPADECSPCVFATEQSDFIQCRIDGSYCLSGPITPHKYDIIGEWSPEPKKVKGWINIYQPYKKCSVVYDSKKKADEYSNEYANHVRIACIPIEFTEGEGL